MKLQQWMNPLLSMVASLTMCVLLNISQNSKVSSNHQHVTMGIQDKQPISIADAKILPIHQLNGEDEIKLTHFAEKLAILEIALEKDTAHFEQWREEMRKVTETIKLEAKKLEERSHKFELLLVKPTNTI